MSSGDPRTYPEPSASGNAQEAAIQLVRESLTGLQFGYVTIIVQDGVVVQIERTEKRRLRRTKNSS